MYSKGYFREQKNRVGEGKLEQLGVVVVAAVQWLSCVQLFVIPQTVACQASLSIMVFRMGNTCTPMADSCQCIAKPIQYCKVNK